MKTTLHRADSRGYADHGWLKSNHTFSFAGYYEPSRMHFGMLRVLNDDWVAPGMGFGEHPHDNMEIVSIPLSGALAHRDSTGQSKLIETGDVQIMSAGSGLTHSEFNGSQTEAVNFLQIWVFPKERNISPRYEQKKFHENDRINRWQTVVAPEKDNGAIWINQEAWFNLSNLQAGETLDYTLKGKRHGVYLFVIDGKIEAAGEQLNKRDAIGIEDSQQLSIKALEDAQLLLMEVPMASR